MTARYIIALGALLGLLGVALGALGAHALQRLMDERGRTLFELGAHYHLVHALAIVAVGLALKAYPGTALLGAAALALAAGVCVFSGSLYLMALGAPRWLGAITPLGGLALLAGWLMLTVAALRAAP